MTAGRRMHGETPVEIISRDYWFKIVEMLQQNWALIDPAPASQGCIVYFVHDGSGVFDRLAFPSVAKAEVALRRNGFGRYTDDRAAQDVIAAPQPPFRKSSHPNGPIYSSGRFWR